MANLANELRINNWVEANSPMMQVKEITEHTVGLYMPESEADPFLYDIDEISPIHLSSEILEKCGLGKYPYQFHYGYLKIRYGIFFYKYFDIEIELPYLHQLQNLYYALTGEELIYKP